MASKAIDVLADALDNRDIRVAVEVLKATGLHGSVSKPGGETDPELVLWRDAEEWAQTELKRRGRSGSKITDLIGDEAEEAALARRRMIELRKTLD